MVGTVPAETCGQADFSKTGVTTGGAEEFSVESAAEDVSAQVGADSVLEAGVAENVWCNRCWEVLPAFCGCGAVRVCSHCAGGLLMGPTVEPECSKTDGELVLEAAAEFEASVQERMQSMAEQIAMMGSMAEEIGSMTEAMQSVREDVASRRDFDDLLERLHLLEVQRGIAASSGEGIFGDDWGGSVDENFDGYYDDDGNSIPSEFEEDW